MKVLALAALAATLTVGAAAAQSGQAAGGPLGDYSRRNGIDPWGTTLPQPGFGIVVQDPFATGTVVPRQRLVPRGAPGNVYQRPGTVLDDADDE